MTYIEYVENYIDRQEYGDPIYTEDIAQKFMEEFELEEKKASAAVSVAIKRIMDDDKSKNLRRFQKGIYYRVRTSAFGETIIQKGKIIDRKYTEPDRGYETGSGLFYRMGLTTSVPNMRYIATNAARSGTRYDKELDITLCQPKTEITAENKDYLRTLDLLYQMDNIPYDAEHPYDIINAFINRCGLRYDVLLSYADKFYNKKTVLRLGHVARVGLDTRETEEIIKEVGEDMPKRPSFENFKSTMCHRLKRLGDVDFMLKILKDEDIRIFYKWKWYPECLYTLAMLDYLSRINDVPICSEYNDLRKMKLDKPVFPLGVITTAVIEENDDIKEQALKEAIPEFLRFNIIEGDVRDVV